jgi:hypothetical protein
MGIGQKRVVPAGLERLRQRFEWHRETHKVRSRIPNSLWAAAIKLASIHGINRTAKTLRLDYYALKKRLERQPAAKTHVPKVGDSIGFVELAGITPVGSGECCMELENADGEKMRVQLRGVAMPDLVLLSRSFWGRPS